MRADDLVKPFELLLLNSRGDLSRNIGGSYVSYAGLALAGYLDHIQKHRVVLLGESELGYLTQLGDTTRRQRWREFCSHPEISCAITCYPELVTEELIDIANESRLAILGCPFPPRVLMPRLIEFLRHALAPRKHMHGVAIDVYGMGILLTGKSAIGKSECALELVKRGHRLVSDDVIILKKISDDKLLAICTDQLRHHMEIRGIGLIDVRLIFGVGAISESKQVDLIICLEELSHEKEYERLGVEQKTETILGVPVPIVTIPVTEGKNLSVVIEAAAMNQHLRQLGINTALELTDRVFKRLNPEEKHKPK